MTLAERIDRYADRTANSIFEKVGAGDPPIDLRPRWAGPVRNKRWRLVLAWKALRGYELDGFGDGGGGHLTRPPG